MHKTIERTSAMTEIEAKLIEWTRDEIAKGKECLNTEELGEVVDIIKDLAEAKEKCWKAKYYESIMEGMEEYNEDGEMDGGRMGYDRYRYPSSGRYAPKGRGKRYGYMPPYMATMHDPFPMNWIEKDFDPKTDGRMGYPIAMPTGDDRYGRPYREYKDARRHYSETHSPEDESMMSEHAKEHMHDTVESIREIWDGAKPELRKKMKADLSNLLSELN